MTATLATAGYALAAPWQHAFMQRALLEVALMALCGGALGTWIVFYELAFAAETFPHAMLPGLVGAVLIGAPLIAGGALGLLVAGAAVVLAARIAPTGRDTAVAVVFTSLFGLGALMALSPQTPPGINDLLFGDILGLSRTDLLLAAALAVVVLASLRVLHPRLTAVALDRLSARSVGVRAARIDLALTILLALAVLVAVQAMGNLFVVATLVAPAAAAKPLARRITTMMAIAILIGTIAGIGGLYLSYYANLAGGASIAAIEVALYAASMTLAAVRHRRPSRPRSGARSRQPLDAAAAG